MGRPELEGVVRYASGRINQAETREMQRSMSKSEKDSGPPSPRILKERLLFNAQCFKGGKLGYQHAGDAIGQLWLLGMIDMRGYDETKLLAAARLWWRGRGETYKALGHKTAAYERASRTSGVSTKQSKLEKAYDRYSRFLLDAGDFERDCLTDLMEIDLDGEMAWWATRIIQTELLKHVRMPIALLATDKDYDKLEAAKRALVAMAGVEAMMNSEERDAA